MQNLFNWNIPEVEKKEIVKKEPKQKPVYTLKDYDFYFILDEENYIYTCIAPTYGKAYSIYAEYIGYMFEEVMGSKIRRVKNLKEFITEKDINSMVEDNLLLKIIYSKGYKISYPYDYDEDEKEIETLEEALKSLQSFYSDGSFRFDYSLIGVKF